ncbi:stalk domain-containing protein [Paenibacillus puerhi]|uniref:stalk domain-containing protein n=1 Tax=Paenibacillus puerhi TaxID=2692622 RepID=UPI00135A33B2|nr:stalk domain-containing protein [Paenibacillus puerhi]
MKKKHIAALSLLLGTLAVGSSVSAVDVSGTTVHIQFQDRQLSAEVDSSEIPLGAPAEIVDGSFYVPIRWLADQLGMEAIWHEGRRAVGLTTAQAYLEWDLERGKASVNGSSIDLEEAAIVRDGSLLVKLSWAAPYMGIRYEYLPGPSRVVLTYETPTDSAYRESTYPGDTQPNSRPITIFATDKASYRIGEPIQYIDLSYDADAEGLPEYRWTGKEDAFFRPGTYAVTLEARDRHGNWSSPYTRHIQVSDESYLSEAEYPWYTSPVGTLIKSTSEAWKDASEKAVPLTSLVTRSSYRQRVVSGENHRILETGLLKRQTVNGHARLLSHHSNGLGKPVELKVIAYNPSTTQNRTVRVTGAGELEPTLLHRTLAKVAVTDFMTRQTDEPALDIAPGQTLELGSYKLEPGQGMASFKDMTTDGTVEIGFVAAIEGEAGAIFRDLSKLVSEQKAPEEGSLDSEVRLDLITDGNNLKSVSSWSPEKKAATDFGLGHTIHYNDPRPVAIALHVKDGHADGIVKVDGIVVPLPQGGLTDQDGAFVAARTTGLESSVHIEWMAAPGNSSPVEWIIYPLQDKK